MSSYGLKFSGPKTPTPMASIQAVAPAKPEEIKASTQSNQIPGSGAPPPSGAPQSAAPGAPSSYIQNMKPMYDQMMGEADKSWGQTKKLLEAQSSNNQRKADLTSARVGAVVGGGLGGNMAAQGMLDSQQNIAAAGLDFNKNKMDVLRQQAAGAQAFNQAGQGQEYQHGENALSRAHDEKMTSINFQNALDLNNATKTPPPQQGGTSTYGSLTGTPGNNYLRPEISQSMDKDLVKNGALDNALRSAGNPGGMDFLKQNAPQVYQKMVNSIQDFYDQYGRAPQGNELHDLIRNN